MNVANIRTFDFENNANNAFLESEAVGPTMNDYIVTLTGS